MRWLIGIAIFIFLFPVCLCAGVFGGCIIAAMTSAVDSSGSLAAVSMGAGALIGVASAVALTVLVVRNIRGPAQPPQAGRYPPR